MIWEIPKFKRNQLRKFWIGKQVVLIVCKTTYHTCAINHHSHFLCTVLGIELRSVLFCKTNCLVLQLLLFDVESDPEERINLAKSHPDIVREMKEEIERAKSRRPPHPKYEHYHNFSHLLL